jgi:hypothetical protein
LEPVESGRTPACSICGLPMTFQRPCTAPSGPGWLGSRLASLRREMHGPEPNRAASA